MDVESWSVDDGKTKAGKVKRARRRAFGRKRADLIAKKKAKAQRIIERWRAMSNPRIRPPWWVRAILRMDSCAGTGIQLGRYC